MGQGFGGFLDLREKVFFLMQCLGAGLSYPSQVEVFFFTMILIILYSVLNNGSLDVGSKNSEYENIRHFRQD